MKYESIADEMFTFYGLLVQYVLLHVLATLFVPTQIRLYSRLDFLMSTA